MTKYRVHLSAGEIIRLDAVKVNTGVRRLWFFDGENNLVGVFWWNNIAGFCVEGSASAQVITDRVPIDMGKIPAEEFSESTRLELEHRRREQERNS